ncbi:MAG: phosphate ABC transporter substrate-binding protein PstS [Spirochaetales bacterium]|nr:phosphate ABC transporter substrate-binding protein PstS [Spirochaetales bacterium]
MLKRIFSVAALASLVLGTATAQTSLTGSGATFPEPLYRKMFDAYNKQTRVKVNYQGIGSGGGIKQLTDKVTDFGATDAFMNEKELAAAGAPIVHIPTCIGAVVVCYNIPGVNTGLKLTPDIIAGLFLGKITKWNDPAIAAENPKVKLPDMSVSVVHRSDSSGTSYVFTDYLTKVNAEWKDKVGMNKSPNWPTGIGGKGNPGVADLVRRVPGAVGYVELVYASVNKIAFAQIKNKSGAYVTPSLKSASAAAAVDLPDDTRVSITDTDAKDGYPIATFTWLILYKEQDYNRRTKAQAKAAVDLLWWVVHAGQRYNEGLYYSQIAPAVVKKCEYLLKSVTYGGVPLLK